MTLKDIVDIRHCSHHKIMAHQGRLFRPDHPTSHNSRAQEAGRQRLPLVVWRKMITRLDGPPCRRLAPGCPDRHGDRLTGR